MLNFPFFLLTKKKKIINYKNKIENSKLGSEIEINIFQQAKCI
jgi:hypothetical protein